MAFEAQGNTGRVLVGYQRAADLSYWEIRRDEETIGDQTTVLTGTLANVNEFWITYSRVKVELQMNKCFWIWDDAEMQSLDPLVICLQGNPRSLPRE